MRFAVRSLLLLAATTVAALMLLSAAASATPPRNDSRFQERRAFSYVKNPAYVSSVACPSTSQCTAVDVSGAEVTFNPSKPGSPKPVGLNQNARLFDILYDISCPSTAQCTAVGKLSEADGKGGVSGDEVTFNPTNPGTPTVVDIGLSGRDGGLSFVACPSTSQCTALDGQRGGEVTFNPTKPGTPKVVEIDHEDFDGLACPSTSQCTATDEKGREVRFNPAKPGAAKAFPIELNSTISEVACPSTSQCTVVGAGSGDGEMTFNPGEPGIPKVIETTGAGETQLDGIACPSASQCTAVGSGEVTFNPTNPGTPNRLTIDHTGLIGPRDPGNVLVGVSCPSKSQCTAVDPVGNEVTFNPVEPGRPRVVAIDRLGALTISTTTTIPDTCTPSTTGATSTTTCTPAT